jgi:hypothetical protein
VEGKNNIGYLPWFALEIFLIITILSFIIEFVVSYCCADRDGITVCLAGFIDSLVSGSLYKKG